MIKVIYYALRDLLVCAQFKKCEKTHGGVLLLVKLQVSPCNFTNIVTHQWVFFTFLNYKSGTKSRFTYIQLYNITKNLYGI